MSLNSVRLAGHVVDDPVGHLLSYACTHNRTLRLYDGPGQGDPDRIALDEARRTRHLASRVSEDQAVQICRLSDEPSVARRMSAVPADARLADADPLVGGNLYDDAVTMYEAFSSSAPPRVRGGKLHKILHIKRPGLIPILDSKLRRLYKDSASKWARTLRIERGLVGHGYWAAIRSDLIDATNAAAFATCRTTLASTGAEGQLLLGLSDLRLLDILAWRI